MKKEEIKLTLKADKLDYFRSIISDVIKINKTFRIKLEDDKMLLYAMDDSGNQTLAFKAYTFDIDEFLEIEKDELFDEFTEGEFGEEESDNKLDINWIIENGSVLNKKLAFFRNKDIKCKLSLREVKEDVYVRNINMTDGKFKMSIIGGEGSNLKNINYEQLNNLLDYSKAETNVVIPTVDFNDAKRLSVIDSDEENVCFSLREGNVIISQVNWELRVNETDYEGSENYVFNKKYLKSVNPKTDEITMYGFGNFVLFQEGNERFMVSYERTF